MPTILNLDEHREAAARAQDAAFREFELGPPPSGLGAQEIWMQHAVGFILFERVRAAGLATLDPTAPSAVRTAVELAVDAATYALMMQIDGVSGGLSGPRTSIELTFGVEMRSEDDAVLSKVDLREGDGMCMGFHSWVEGEFGEHPVVR